MGQKVNPNGMRVGVYRGWTSRWYANNQDYAKFLNEDLKIRKYFEKTLKDAQLSRVEIERVVTSESGYKVIVFVHVARPGVVIGQDGKNINEHKKQLLKIVNTGEIRLDVIPVENPDLDATIVAKAIASQLEARASFRVAQKKMIQQVRRSGAKGIKTMISGRLNGAEIARSEGYKEGVVPLHTLRSDIDYGTAEAHMSYGRLGVKVWICRGEYPGKQRKAPNTAKGE